MHYQITQVVKRTIQIDARSGEEAKRISRFRKDWYEEEGITIVQELPDKKHWGHGDGVAHSDDKVV
jgi:N-dimethylarginine dimethylaminohydrolase